MGKVQNGCLYIRYGSSSRKTKQRSGKSLQTTFLCYSITKSTLYIPLTFLNVEKPNVKNFLFCLSSSFLVVMCNQKLYTVCEHYTHQMTALLMEIFDQLYPKRNVCSFRHFFGFSHNKCMCGWKFNFWSVHLPGLFGDTLVQQRTLLRIDTGYPQCNTDHFQRCIAVTIAIIST